MMEMPAMEITLHPDEARLLKEIVTNYLSNLRMEITRTEDYDLRKGLQEDELIARTVLARLEGK